MTEQHDHEGGHPDAEADEARDAAPSVDVPGSTDAADTATKAPDAHAKPAHEAPDEALDSAAIEADPAAPDTWWAQGTAAEEPAEAPGADTALRPGLEKAPPMVVGIEHLATVLESLIFVADKPLTEKQLAQLSHASIQEVRVALDRLAQHYETRGIELHFVAGGYQFRSSSRNAAFVRTFVAPKPVRISRALLETLAIIAYRQPVTRPEIDEIRGVDSGEALKSLAERNLIRILGRKDEPGRPLLYGTTTHFLEFFGISSLRDLPTLREYSELTDESRALFERRMGEPLDLKSVEAEARAAEAAVHSTMFDALSNDDGEDASEPRATDADGVSEQGPSEDESTRDDEAEPSRDSPDEDERDEDERDEDDEEEE